jgi:hypothetical protein
MRDLSGRALALVAGVVFAFAASCGGGGGAGGAGGTSGGTAGGGPGGTGGGAAGNAGGGTGGTTPSCSGCRADQICVQGACMDLPGQCPCPVESYCDLAVSRCVAGCTRNEECSPARVCNVTARTCLDGCRDDASCGAGRICENYACRDGCRTQAACGAGFICLNMVCQAGCASTTDCTATGQTCVSNVCQCPASQQACGGACTRVDTVMNCGACGNACAKNQVCMAGQCACPPGTCTPEVVYSDGTRIGGFWIDGTYLYVVETTSDGGVGVFTMRRKPLAGGAIEPVGQLTDYAQQIKVAGGQILWSVETGGSTSGILYAMPGAGGTTRTLDSYPNPGTVGFAHDGTNAYWWHYPRTGTGRIGELYQITIATIARRLVVTDADPATTFIQGNTLYFHSGDGRIRSYNLSSGGTTLSAVRPGTSSVLTVGTTVDSTGHTLCERTGTSSANGTQAVVRLALNGTGMTTLATETGYPLNCWVTTNDTHVYYYGWDYKALKRVPKAGGAVETIISEPAGGLHRMAINGGYVYYGNASTNDIRRIATTYSP